MKLRSDLIPVLLRQGYSTHGSYLYFKWRAHSNIEGTLCWQVLVPLKVAKQAVKRNHLKRQLREIVREFMAGYPMSRFDLLIVAKPAINQATFVLLQQELIQLLGTLVVKGSPS